MARSRAGLRLSRLLISSDSFLQLRLEVIKEYKRIELNWFGLIGFVWFGKVWFCLVGLFSLGSIVYIPYICHFFTRAKFLENKIYTEIYTVNCQFTQ